MPNKTRPKTKQSARSAVTVSSGKPIPSQQLRKAPSFPTKRSVPAASTAKSKTVFKNFSLSRFAGKPPANYVVAGESYAPVQKKRIIQKLKDLSIQKSTNVGMAVAVPKSNVQQLLPKLNQKTKTMDLNDFMNFIQENMRGKQFFATGNPTLNRLAIRSRVQQILRANKGGAK